MASFRSFPPQSSFPPPPTQNPLPQAPPAAGSNQFPPNRGFSGGTGSHQPPSFPPNPNSHHAGYGSSSHHYGGPPRPQPPPQQQQSYPYMPPQPPAQSPFLPGAPPPLMPPPSMGSQPPQPPPPMYYPSSQYTPFDPHAAPPPPPPPSSPPPEPSMPPPPPPSAPPPSLPPPPPPHSSNSQPHHSKDTRSSNHGHHRREHKEPSGSGWHSKHGLPPKQHKSSAPPQAMPRGRVETEEERRLRKRREYEKQKQEEKHRQHLKESQKTQMSSGVKGHGSMAGSRMGERKATPFLSAERIENKLKKPTTFLCKLKFRDELPAPTEQPKGLLSNTSKDLYNKYTITSLEKMHKPKLYVEPDLGIPLDLLDISVYNPPSRRPTLAPEDEELLHDVEFRTPVKQDGIKRKDRPTDQGFSWLVKTQYISSFSANEAKTPLSEKQAKERRDSKGGRNILDNLNNREKQIQAIEASFEACKSVPVHATNNRLYPVETLPLLPDFARYDDRLVLAAFDSEPTADSEIYGKLDRSVRDEHEAQAIMKSIVVSGSDPAKPEKFLAYMVPSPDELWKDIYDESEDISYSWVREYQWDVRGDDTNDPTTYLVTFGEETSRYLPLPTKLVLRKKRAKEGRSKEEVEHFPVPSSVTVRRRAEVAAVELKDSGYATSKGSISRSKRGRSGSDDSIAARQKVARHQEMDHFSEAEEEDDISV